jgi:hypothetical protein
MATGRNIQLTRQIGEYLAAAELGRRGWIATTFTGHIPGFDLVAVNEAGRSIEVQVKAIASATWQLNAGQFLDIEIRKKTQFVRGIRPLGEQKRYCIFLRLLEYGRDEFYLFRWRDLQRILRRDYKAGRRPVNPETLHHALYPQAIVRNRDNWKVLDS